jgi:GNAT superfamily N-acetyltransferase
MSTTVTKVVTSELWPDLVALFGERGAASGSWCMWFRVPPRQWSANGREGNRIALQGIVAEGRAPGLLAFRDGRPVGWISVAPRSEFRRIQPEDAGEDGVWSVVCFYIEAGQRGSGVAAKLLAAGIQHARKAGARILEAYPLERAGASNADAFTGPRSLYEKAGFRETGRFDRWAAVPQASGEQPRRLVRAPGRPVMRLEL